MTIIQPGTNIGRYHILEQLGEGGMAVVYKAYDLRHENEVAIKVIRTERLVPEYRERTLKRFQVEARNMSQLSHPNIVRVEAYGEHAGAPYLVMPYHAGGTLKSKLGKAMPVEDALRLLLPIADALSYAHNKGLVHRDVKPSNILISESGEPMLTDFGIAKVISSEETLDLTLTGMGLGTPDYMAPEQAEGKVIDARADIYALGVVLYELLTGRKPFTADTPMAVLIKHARDPLPKPSAIVADIPASVEKMLYKVLAKQPGQRYQSMAEMMAAMQDALKGAKDEPGDQRHPSVLKEATTNVVRPPRAQEKKQGGSSTPMWLAIGLATAAVGIIFVISSRGRAPAKAGPEEQPVAQSMESEVSTAAMPSTPTPTVIPTPTLGIGSSMTSDKDSMTLVYVPAGEFLMGSSESDADAVDSEKPQHNVYLDAFWIDQTEVTNAKYALCVADGACSMPFRSSSYTRDSYYGNADFDDYPVINVIWQQASDYCTWAGRRLPTEAEWEKAARGTDGRIYPWGNSFYGDQLNYCDQSCEFDWKDSDWDDGFSDTAPVDSYPAGASPYGALDMVGNVWEWTADWWDEGYYSKASSSNPTGPSFGEARVLRGGSWTNNVNTFRPLLRIAYRSGYDPNYEEYIENIIGFRCALDSSL